MVRRKRDQDPYMLNIVKYTMEAAFLCINGDSSLRSLFLKSVKGLSRKML
jgi:hypothetical protein